MPKSHVVSSRPLQRDMDAPPPYSQYHQQSNLETPTETASTPPSTIASISSIRSANSTPPPVVPAQDVTKHERGDDSKFLEAPLPADIVRARAPLRIEQENRSINSSFLVFSDEVGSSKSPDMSLKTTNSRIKSAVYVDGNEWGRPAVIEADTTNSSIALTVYTLSPGQAVDISAKTSNSSNTVYLPRDFKGLLSMSTTNAKGTLGSELQQAAVRISNPDGDSADDKRAVWYEINGSDGPSRAMLKTKNAKVSAAFAGEENASSGSSCTIM